MNDARTAARRWIDDDPDPETRALGEQILARGDPAELEDAFGHRLAFGTAGIRGALGPGPGRMNRALVRRVTAGLAEVVARAPGSGPVVVGCDARRGSAAFADDAARVLAGAGLPVVRFPGVCPTPLVAYAVRALGGRAGVMVTASHNPPGDNGYKVYGPSGGQIVPPLDVEISAAIDRVGPTRSIPLADAGVSEVPAGLVDAYLGAVAGLRVHHPARTVRIVYTPLHGVGGELALRVLAAAGHTDVVVVPEQFEPDGAFPTVAFPNPEEKGALDRALALAERVGAELVLANDPDADRIAVAVRGRLLSGNEVGTLLAEDLLTHGPGDRRLVATTVVSSTLLGRIAAAHGAEYAETWTGFKWIAQAAASSSARFVLGYEEALGVCVGEVVRDKDGLSAALLVADLAAELASRGRTLVDALDDLHHKYGVHLGSQVTVTAPGAAGLRRIADTMAAVRARPWEALGGIAVTGYVDHAVPGASGRPPADVLSFTLGSDRVLLRPSGTEPKLKVYLEVVEAVTDGLDAARDRARARLGRLEAAVRAATSP